MQIDNTSGHAWGTLNIIHYRRINWQSILYGTYLNFKCAYPTFQQSCLQVSMLQEYSYMCKRFMDEPIHCSCFLEQNTKYSSEVGSLSLCCAECPENKRYKKWFLASKYLQTSRNRFFASPFCPSSVHHGSWIQCLMSFINLRRILWFSSLKLRMTQMLMVLPTLTPVFEWGNMQLRHT